MNRFMIYAEPLEKSHICSSHMELHQKLNDHAELERALVGLIERFGEVQ